MDSKKTKQDNKFKYTKVLVEDQEETSDGPARKKLKLDTNRTGAKCVAGEADDPLGPGADYHTIGAIRRKPGRGDPTLSLSCSDKLLKWNVIGFQVHPGTVFIGQTGSTKLLYWPVSSTCTT